MFPHTLLRPLAAALLLLAAAGAQAQYAWIGANGTRQYSDKPPPPGTPADKILKAPRSYAPPAPAPADTKGPPTLAEREQAYQERNKTRAEEQLNAEQEALQKKQLAERCAAARETQAQLASGMRIAQVDRNGERSYMSDGERAARSERVRQALQDCR